MAKIATRFETRKAPTAPGSARALLIGSLLLLSRP
jgi:hypothetical protein